MTVQWVALVVAAAAVLAYVVFSVRGEVRLRRMERILKVNQQLYAQWRREAEKLTSLLERRP